MGHRAIAFTLSAALVLAASARGAFINASGTIHATASASSTGGPSVSSTPGDTGFSPPNVFAQNTATASTNGSIGGPQSANITAMVDFTSHFHISGSGSVTSKASQTDTSSFVSAGANGTFTFTENTTENLTATGSGGNTSASASLTVKNSSNQTVLAMSLFGFSVSPQNITLPPDTYTGTWSMGVTRQTSFGNGAGWDFNIATATPEPSSLVVALGGGAMASSLRRRRFI